MKRFDMLSEIKVFATTKGYNARWDKAGCFFAYMDHDNIIFDYGKPRLYRSKALLKCLFADKWREELEAVNKMEQMNKDPIPYLWHKVIGDKQKKTTEPTAQSFGEPAAFLTSLEKPYSGVGSVGTRVTGQ